ncbi:MAG: hypothetical protein A3H50_03380 [Candidatus Levybacteria bacterium RIFCSPLOWO2_02_FULL_37_10]|uniref:Uncharacterized protein n=1 Tax=Candidatus Portnoybacteria bacterium RIFCSPLOWO2_01_FULL_43_11 TaxID=1802000 RepID=A0A1G2FN68_9BACT|nr:MAG: hypothetical protein A3H50_03380 [Candidatus Levybacteria bacterium RIFCSPLOWO2_02_FULL_37_10]OGZ37328.1 MAG: hypothetical protein A3D38_02100 [Candidatus Portnoybacteria bacterium RIFCSPHIGHO2_02_FULL_40_23]OGZ39050.1 MAG: hypothetical protein A3A94_01865 [Candidatus Portnoybacteria bacterium RIFCSPLOWO2_01_FULL_43_11]
MSKDLSNKLEETVAGLFKFEGNLYRISDTPDGGLKSEVFKDGVFVPGGNMAELTYSGERVEENPTI